MIKILEEYFFKNYIKYKLKTINGLCDLQILPILVTKEGFINHIKGDSIGITGYDKKELVDKHVSILLPEYNYKKIRKSDTNKGYTTRSHSLSRRVEMTKKNNCSFLATVKLEIFKCGYVVIFIYPVASNKQKCIYEFFLEKTNDIICVFSDKGVLTKINQSFIDIIGYKEEEVFGKPFTNFIENFKQILNKNTSKIETTILCKSGERKDVLVDTVVNSGNTLVIIKDIALQKKKIRELNQSKTMINEAEKLTLFGTLKISSIKEDLSISDGLKKILDVETLNYENYINMINLSDKEKIISVIDKCLYRGESYECLYIINQNGVEKNIYTKGVNVEGDVIAVIKDVTEKLKIDKELKEAKEFSEQSSNAKSIFLANVSHEIRTPINSIIGMASLLSTTDITDEQREYTDVIKESCGMLLSLINNILNFSKIEAGKEEIFYEEFDLETTIENLETVYCNITNSKGLYFNIKIDSAVPKFIISDEVKIKQILTNLLNNAVKFTKKGGISLVINSYNNYLKFDICDTGIGISSENQNKLFKPFSQVDSTLVKDFSGTGLGLAICRKLVILLGGNIKLMSHIDEGTVISVNIPLKLSKDKSFIQKYNPKDKVKAIVIVEDNKANQFVVCKYMEKIGVQEEIKIFSNGVELLKDLHTIDPLFILMDIHMPLLDGYDTSKELRKMGIKCPIIACTANTMDGVLEKCTKVQIDDIIYKPFAIKELRHMLYKYGIIKDEK